MGNRLVEGPRLYIQMDFLVYLLCKGLDPSVIGPRREVQKKKRGQQPSPEGKYKEGAEESPVADPECFQCHDFAVSGHAAEAGEDPQEYGHGDGKGENGGEHEAEQFEYGNKGHPPCDEHFDGQEYLVEQHDEGIGSQPEQEGREDLLQYVPVDQLNHVCFIP